MTIQAVRAPWRNMSLSFFQCFGNTLFCPVYTMSVLGAQRPVAHRVELRDELGHARVAARAHVTDSAFQLRGQLVHLVL